MRNVKVRIGEPIDKALRALKKKLDKEGSINGQFTTPPVFSDNSMNELFQKHISSKCKAASILNPSTPFSSQNLAAFTISS